MRMVIIRRGWDNGPPNSGTQHGWTASISLAPDKKNASPMTWCLQFKEEWRGWGMVAACTNATQREWSCARNGF